MDNNNQNNQDSNKPKKPVRPGGLGNPNPNQPFNAYWIYAILSMGLIGMLFFGQNKTIKKGRLKWHKSKSYIRTRDKLAETERKLKDKRYMLHNILANEILKVSNVVKTEDLEYKKLQQRFGRSTSFRSPATFISILKRKVLNIIYILIIISYF